MTKRQNMKILMTTASYIVPVMEFMISMHKLLISI